MSVLLDETVTAFCILLELHVFPHVNCQCIHPAEEFIHLATQYNDTTYRCQASSHRLYQPPVSWVQKLL